LTSKQPEEFELGVPSTKASSRKIILGIVVMALFMSTVDTTIVATALPAIHRGLHATINWAGWTITMYGLGMVVALPTAGKLSDQFGRRRVFLIGVTLFTTASLICGFSTDIYMLVAFRAVQAIGGGTLQPSSAGIVSDNFGRNRDRVLGLFGTITAAGQVTGPVLGGLFVAYLSWRWIFFVNVPIGIVLIALIYKFIPPSVRRETSRVDVKGAVLFASFIVASIFGISELGIGHASPLAPMVLVPESCAALLFYCFARHLSHVEDSFIPLRLLRAKGFAAVNGISILWGVCGFGTISLIPLYAVQRYHLMALDAGTLLTARAFGMIMVGAIATIALRRTGYRLPMMVGFTVVALGTMAMSIAPRLGFSPYLWLSIGACIAGIGNGMANPSSKNASMQLAPESVAAIIGLRSMFNNVGIIFSVSIVTAILSRSADPGLAQAHILWIVAAILFFVMVPLVTRVPEHKGRW
jgi:EmrB/QacA subfamily drug resistance transporter